MPDFNYTWATTPPIVVYEGNAANAWARKYGSQMLGYIRDYRTGLPDQPEFTGLSHENIDNAEIMCDKFIGADLEDSEILCVYKLAGSPIALMILTIFSNDLYISDLIVHPAAEFGGSIMIEFGVNYCAVAERPPVLTLWALDETALGSYLGMGFVSNTEKPRSMTLDLTTPKDKWENFRGQWRYSSSRAPGPMYARAAPTVPPKPRRKHK